MPEQSRSISHESPSDLPVRDPQMDVGHRYSCDPNDWCPKDGPHPSD